MGICNSLRMNGKRGCINSYNRFKTENMIHGPLVCKIEAQSILRAQQMCLQEPA